MASFSGGRGTASTSGGGRGGMTSGARASVHAQATSNKAARGAGVQSHHAGAQSVGSRWGRGNAYRNTHR